MTVFNSTIKTGPLVGDGSATEFYFDFYIEDATWLKVYLFDAEGALTIPVLTTHYTIAASAIQNVNGGKVTFVTAPEDGAEVVFKINPPGTQERDLENIGAWSPEQHEKGYDKLTYLILAVQEELSRALVAPINDPDFDFDDLLAAIQAAAGYAAQALQYSLNAKEWYELTLALSLENLFFGGTKVLTFADSPYTVLTADNNTILACDTTDGNIVINLPSIAVEGEPFVLGIRKDTPDANTITLVRSGTDTINDIAGNHAIGAFKELITIFADEDKTPDDWGLRTIGLRAGDVFWQGWIATGLSNPDALETFTPGTTASLTLAQDPENADNIEVFVEGRMIPKTMWGLSGVTLTFDTPIPLGVREVWVRVSIELPIGSTVGPNQLTPQAAARLLIGQGVSNPMLYKDVTGDVTITAAGVTAIGAEKVTGAMLKKNINGTVQDLSSSGGTLTWDIDSGNFAKTTLTENIATLTISNIANAVHGALWAVTQHASAAKTITWPSNVRWSGGSAPTVATLSAKYLFVLNPDPTDTSKFVASYIPEYA